MELMFEERRIEPSVEPQSLPGLFVLEIRRPLALLRGLCQVNAPIGTKREARGIESVRIAYLAVSDIPEGGGIGEELVPEELRVPGKRTIRHGTLYSTDLQTSTDEKMKKWAIWRSRKFIKNAEVYVDDDDGDYDTDDGGGGDDDDDGGGDDGDDDDDGGGGGGDDDDDDEE
jgi:hypothetical protein